MRIEGAQSHVHLQSFHRPPVESRDSAPQSDRSNAAAPSESAGSGGASVADALTDLPAPAAAPESRPALEDPRDQGGRAVEHAQERLDRLASFVNEKIDGVLASGELDEEGAAAVEQLRTDFFATLDGLMESLANGERLERSEFGSAVRSAHETMAHAVKGILSGDVVGEGEPTDPYEVGDTGGAGGGKNPVDVLGSGAAAFPDVEEAPAPAAAPPASPAGPTLLETYRQSFAANAADFLATHRLDAFG